MVTRRVCGRGPWLPTVILLLAWVLAAPGCGSSGTTTGAPSAGATTGDRLYLPSAETMAALEGRIAAWMRGDGRAAADFYAEDGVLREMDTTPDYVSEGRENIRWRLTGLYDMGLRLRQAGLPLQYDRYVAEPAALYPYEDESQAAVTMLVFEMDADDKIAYQWVVPGGGRPAPDAVGTPPTSASQPTSRPNLPTPEAARLLEGWMAALGREDGRAAAACFADDGVMREVDHTSGVASRGRGRIAVRLQRLLASGVRLEPAGASIQCDRMVAAPVRVRRAAGAGAGAAMLVLALDAHDKIASMWVIGEVD